MSGASLWLDAKEGAADKTRVAIAMMVPPATARVLRMYSPVLGMRCPRSGTSTPGVTPDGSFSVNVQEQSRSLDDSDDAPVVADRRQQDTQRRRGAADRDSARP